MFRAISNLNVDERNLPKQPKYWFKKPLKLRVIEKIIGIFKSKDVEKIMNMKFDNRQVWDSTDESQAITVIKKFGMKGDVNFISLAFEKHTKYVDYLFLVEISSKSISVEMFGKINDDLKKSLNLAIFNVANDEFNLYFNSINKALSKLGDICQYISPAKIVIEADNIPELEKINSYYDLVQTNDDNISSEDKNLKEYLQEFTNDHTYKHKKESLYETWVMITLLVDSMSWGHFHVITVDGNTLTKDKFFELRKGIPDLN